MVVALMLFVSTSAMAQQTPRAETSIGYAAVSAGNDSYPKGYYVDFVANVTPRLGIVVATDAAYRRESLEYLVLGGRRVPGEGTVVLERLPVTLETTTRGLMAGARITWRDPRVDLYVQGAGGAAHLAAHADIDSSTPSAASVRDAYRASRWRAAVQAGAGANIPITSPTAVRLGVDYRRLERVPRGFIESEDSGRGPNQVMFAAGFTWMFGS
jgi:opacity protein-like surface antigen